MGTISVYTLLYPLLYYCNYMSDSSHFSPRYIHRHVFMILQGEVSVPYRPHLTCMPVRMGLFVCFNIWYEDRLLFQH
jgi:hypothetical protein